MFESVWEITQSPVISYLPYFLAQPQQHTASSAQSTEQTVTFSTRHVPRNETDREGGMQECRHEGVSIQDEYNSVIACVFVGMSVVM